MKFYKVILVTFIKEVEKYYVVVANIVKSKLNLIVIFASFSIASLPFYTDTLISNNTRF